MHFEEASKGGNYLATSNMQTSNLSVLRLLRVGNSWVLLRLHIAQLPCSGQESAPRKKSCSEGSAALARASSASLGDALSPLAVRRRAALPRASRDDSARVEHAQAPRSRLTKRKTSQKMQERSVEIYRENSKFLETIIVKFPD